MKKSMKLLLPLLLAFLVSVSAVQAAAAGLHRGAPADITNASQTDTDDGIAESEDPVGFWKLAEMTGARPVSREDVQRYEVFGQVMYLEIREDGTAVLSVYGDEMEGTWEKGQITIAGDSCPLTIEGNTLSISNQVGDVMVFDRSSREELDTLLGLKEGVLDEAVSYLKDEQTILDSEEASVVITGYKADKTGFTVSLRCENKTDNGVMISAEKCFLNKYLFSPAWAISLTGKESKDSEMKFRISDFEKCGISAVDEMLLELQTVNTENWSTIQKVPVTLYPTGKKAEEIETAERASVENEQIIIDDEFCKFIIEGTTPNHVLGYTVNCYFENKTNDVLTFIWMDEHLNDQEASGLFAQELMPGTRGYSDALFLQSALEKTGIDPGEIKTVQAKIMVYDGEKNLVAEKEFIYEPNNK